RLPAAGSGDSRRRAPDRAGPAAADRCPVPGRSVADRKARHGPGPRLRPAARLTGYWSRVGRRGRVDRQAGPAPGLETAVDVGGPAETERLQRRGGPGRPGAPLAQQDDVIGELGRPEMAMLAGRIQPPL